MVQVATPEGKCLGIAAGDPAAGEGHRAAIGCGRHRGGEGDALSDIRGVWRGPEGGAGGGESALTVWLTVPVLVSKLVSPL